MVPVHALRSAWPYLWPMLEPAAKRSPDKPDLLPMLVNGDAQLWAIVEDDKPIAAVVTRISLIPERRVLLWLIGGARTREWGADFVTRIEAYAREWNCVALWGVGRRGWARVVDKLGFERAEDSEGMGVWIRRLPNG